MRNVTGLLLFAVGSWLIYAALARRGRVLAARSQASARGEAYAAAPIHPSLAALGDVVPPMIVMGLGFVGVKGTLAYAALGGGRVFSLFDLAGFLFLLAAYGTWLLLTTRYREAAQSATPADRRPAVAGVPVDPEEPARVEPANPAVALRPLDRAAASKAAEPDRDRPPTQRHDPYAGDVKEGCAAGRERRSA